MKNVLGGVVRKMSFHPGYYIKEIIEDMNITDAIFSNITDIDLEVLKAIIDGKKSIDMEIAQKLSDTFNCSVEMWMNLQKKYDVSSTT